jgi:hypothetical protein
MSISPIPDRPCAHRAASVDPGVSTGLRPGHDFVFGAFPGIKAAIQNLGVLIPHHPVLYRLTGGRHLTGSGTIEDDLLVLLDLRQSILELRSGDRTRQPHFAARFSVRVSAYENGLACLGQSVNI